MEPALQLILNVIGITGVSSLATICYLLRQENRKLADQLKQDGPKTRVAIPRSSASNRDGQQLPALLSPAAPKDIRLLAADRRKGWVEGLSSAISYDGCC